MGTYSLFLFRLQFLLINLASFLASSYKYCFVFIILDTLLISEWSRSRSVRSMFGFPASSTNFAYFLRLFDNCLKHFLARFVNVTKDQLSVGFSSASISLFFLLKLLFWFLVNFSNFGFSSLIPQGLESCRLVVIRKISSLLCLKKFNFIV